jgi:sigma-E factor negative regulatory protein RseC
MSVKENTECIEHDGIVQESGINHVKVMITSSSACAGCHAEGSCSLSGTKEKIIDVTGSYNVSAGEKVIVLMKQSAGFLALFLGYIFPLILVMTVLVILISLSMPELTAGLFSIFAVVPYYGILWLFRKRIGKKFTFSIKT